MGRKSKKAGPIGDFSDEEEEETTTTPVEEPTTTKKGAKKPAKGKAVDEEEEEEVKSSKASKKDSNGKGKKKPQKEESEEEDEEEEVTTKASSKKAPAKQGKQKASKPSKSDDEEEEEEEKSNGKKKASKPAKDSKKKASKDEDEEEEEEDVPTKAKKTATNGSDAKKKKKKGGNWQEYQEEEEEEPEQPKAKGKDKKQESKKAKKVEEEEEEEEEKPAAKAKKGKKKGGNWQEYQEEEEEEEQPAKAKGKDKKQESKKAKDEDEEPEEEKPAAKGPKGKKGKKKGGDDYWENAYEEDAEAAAGGPTKVEEEEEAPAKKGKKGAKKTAAKEEPAPAPEVKESESKKKKKKKQGKDEEVAKEEETTTTTDTTAKDTKPTGKAPKKDADKAKKDAQMSKLGEMFRKQREEQEKAAKEEEERRLKEEEEERLREEEEARLEEERQRKKEAKKARKKENQQSEALKLQNAKNEAFKQSLREKGLLKDGKEEGGAEPKKQSMIYESKKKNKPKKNKDEEDEKTPEVAAPAAPQQQEPEPTPEPEKKEEEEEAADNWEDWEETLTQKVAEVKITPKEEEKPAPVPAQATKAAVPPPTTAPAEKKPEDKPKTGGKKDKKAGKKGSNKNDDETEDKTEEKKEEAPELRSPICCILGHVDTGKTSLLDKIRHTNVQEGEAGGITQQIGATYFPMKNIQEMTKSLAEKYNVQMQVPGLLVIDTPGHESFTNLRSRGSGLCDIAILVVDIMHALEPQTIESINLLRMRKTPFVVALNKVDRLYGWRSKPFNPFRDSLKIQDKATAMEFDNRTKETINAFAAQGLNAVLYYNNKDPRKYVSLVPTSAHTGEGIPDLLLLLVQLTQRMMAERLSFTKEVQCTVLEVKVIEGLGTTLDVILVNGVLKEGDTIVLCGMNGPIVTTIRALLTPQPLRELRIKSNYEHHSEIKAAMGIKIVAQDLEKAVAGSALHVGHDEDEIEDLKDEVQADFDSILKSVDSSSRGVCVQASTLGSLEALLTFLKASKIPVSGVNIGPIHKKDVIRASVMLEKNPEFAVILAFDVKVEKEAQLMADSLGVQIFTADIIYHLFDRFTKYMDDLKAKRREEGAALVVWPCLLRIKQEAQYIFNKKNPIVVGMDVLNGTLKLGTPLCIPANNYLDIGVVTGIEKNHKQQTEAKKGDEVAVKIESAPGNAKEYGKHFDSQHDVCSKISRESIDALVKLWGEDLSQTDRQLILKLKSVFKIQ